MNEYKLDNKNDSERLRFWYFWSSTAGCNFSSLSCSYNEQILDNNNNEKKEKKLMISEGFLIDFFRCTSDDATKLLRKENVLKYSFPPIDDYSYKITLRRYETRLNLGRYRVTKHQDGRREL